MTRAKPGCSWERFCGDHDTPTVRYLGFIAVADKVRKEAPAIIARLHQLGVKARCHADRRWSSASPPPSAKACGVDEVHANLLPQDKVRVITETKGIGASIGDGR